MLELTEKNFNEELAKNDKLLVFFYREKGCSFCDKAKPVFEDFDHDEKSGDIVCAKYKLGQAPDSVNQKYPIEKFPTFYAFEKGQVVKKMEGLNDPNSLPQMFNPDFQPEQNSVKKVIKVEEAPYSVLMNDEMVLIDQVAEKRSQLLIVQAEIKRRRELAGL